MSRPYVGQQMFALLEVCVCGGVPSVVASSYMHVHDARPREDFRMSAIFGHNT